MTATKGPINLKQNKPEFYDGRCGCLVVNSCLYKVEQYLVLVQFGNSWKILSEEKIYCMPPPFSVVLQLYGGTHLWQLNTQPTTWTDCKAIVATEIVRNGPIRRVRDKLHKMKQITSVSKYLGEF